MFMLEPGQTAWDLRWRMLGIGVRVHPMFWLVTLIMGSNSLRQGVAYLGVWVACVFVSILVHELGHVLAGMAFGTTGYIVLYGMGGLAVGSNQLPHRWQRIVVCFAGPLAGFLFLGLLFVLLWVRDPESFPAYLVLAGMDLGIPPPEGPEWRLGLVRQLTQHPLLFSAVGDLIFINLFWGLVNLLPVWPLDGGQISRDVCDAVAPGRGLSASLGISLVTAGLIAVHSVMEMNGRGILPVHFGSTYTAIFFGLLALQSFQLLQHAQAERRWTDDHEDRRDW